jgi:hypothetical protein
LALAADITFDVKVRSSLRPIFGNFQPGSSEQGKNNDMPLRAHLNWTKNRAPLSAFALHTALQRRKAHLQHAIFFMASKMFVFAAQREIKKKRVASGERGKKHSCCLFSR